MRNTKMDSLKTFLIFMVILGHVIDPYGSGSLNDVNCFVEELIFTFHMPLFIMISGYFCNTGAPMKSFFKRLLEVFATLLVFQFIKILMKGDYSLTAFLTPQYTLWYLLALVYWRLFVYFLNKKLSITVVLLISIVISLGAGFVPITILSFQRACAFLPFFVLGTLIRQKDYTVHLDTIKPLHALLLMLIALLVFVYMGHGLGLNLKKGILIAKSMYPDTMGLLWRALWLPLATFVSLGVYRLIPDKAILAKYGGITLTIYMFHPFFTKQFHYILDATSIPNDLLVNVMYAGLVFAVCVLLSKSKLVGYLVRPLRLSK